MHFRALFTIFAATGLAIPLTTRGNSLTQVLLAVAPTSSSCANAPAPGQCRTADQAAGPIQISFDTYGITTNGEKAALISLMAYESGSFKYNENVYPGRPGQGTRNMQMINFNLLFASSAPRLATKLQTITDGAAASALSIQQQNAVRDLLTSDDNLDFASAAFFLVTQCSSAVRAALQTGSVAGWTQYITECVGTTVADRQAMFTTALQALSG